MTIHLDKVNGFGGGNGGGGGSSSFPAIVTDSGSSLPVDLSGYQEGDTFLNTSDKKIYTVVVNGYELNTSYFSSLQQNPNGSFDGTTGNFSNGGVNFGSNDTFSNGYLCVPIQTDTDIQSQQGIVCSYSGNDGSQIFYVYIYTSSIYIENTKICDILANHKYIVNANVSSGEISITVLEEDGTQIGEQSVSFSDKNNRLLFGYWAGRGADREFFKGTIYRQLGNYNLSVGVNNVVVPSSTLSWDSGTDLTEGQYADKTNGILYLYQDTELIQIPDIDLSNYKLKAETITISTASVTIANVQANKNYVLSSSALTNITLTACETSFEETSIEFTLPADISNFSFIDNSGITWVDGSPTFNASKSYLIVIFNKLGFVKEY